MKKNFKKIIALLLCLVIFFGLTPNTQAASYTSAEFNAKLEEVEKLYPQGSQKYEWKVNDAVVGWQCHGYARWISHYVWGVDFANGDGEGWVRYDATANSTPIEKLVPGDVLRYRTSATKDSNHSIFVTAIDGDTVYFTDCNSDGKNTIKWGRTATKSFLVEHLKMQLGSRDNVEYGYIAHYKSNTLTATARLNVSYNANGGTINLPTQKITQYTVVDSSGINLRSGAGTNFGVVGALPKNTVFTITESKSDSAGTYVWGKTTYNGVTGWCVISKNWTTKTEVTIPPAYYLNTDQGIYLTEGKTPFVESFSFGTEYKNALADSTELGLVREGYTFLGWSKTKDGEVASKPTDTLTPELLFPEAEEKEYSATLYAVWQNNKVLTDIEVATLPNKKRYILNSTFSSSGLKIKLKYSNNTSETITEGFTLSGFDSKTTGEKTITVNYKDKSTTFTVLVEDLKTGDLNKDFSIDLVDVTLLAQYVAGWDVDCDPTALDVNADTDVNLMDIVHLSQYVAGWEEIVLQ